VVTGAAGGIGSEIAYLLAQYSPVLGIDYDAQALSKLVERGRGVTRARIEPALADISSAEQVASAFQGLPAEAKIGCLVNCAAIFDLRWGRFSGQWDKLRADRSKEA
ncbi:MAG: SDR family NAD(P)-dependent oxidoreductase, partial [Acetobacteraceae bacterium]